MVLIAGVLVIGQTATNLKTRGIASGFHLSRPLGRVREIARGPLPYSSRDPYVWALFVGVANTLRVTVAGIILATILGGSSVSPAHRKLPPCRRWRGSTPRRCGIRRFCCSCCSGYALTRALPDPRHAWQPLGGVFLCFRGLYLPALRWHGVSGWFSIEYPAFAGFDFHGGISMTPEFVALLIGLSTCTAAFIGEIVRGGILAVDRGQADAAAALGLSRATALRRVILPQAMRLILPPVTSQFVNVAKNSSLAVAIGYPDVISITNTTVNQTGQAIEALAIAMLVLPRHQPDHRAADECVGTRSRPCAVRSAAS